MITHTYASAMQCYFYSAKEECPISDCKPLLKIFDHNGGVLKIKDHDITITVPELAISRGGIVEIRAAAGLIGPYKLPIDCSPVSVIIWIEADYLFKKPVHIKIPLPHCVSITDPNEIFDIVVLTANKDDLVLNENGDLVLQMHESVYDYQYEINDGYCNYYTDHFCSKCLARRSRIVKLLKEISISSRTKITVFFCVPNNYATENELLIELCICYSLYHCLQVCKVLYDNK